MGFFSKWGGKTPLSDSYWKKKTPRLSRLSNIGEAFAAPPTKKSQRAKKTNDHNRNAINNHKRQKEQCEHDNNQLMQEIERLKGKLYQANSLFETIQSLSTSYPSHWVSRVRTNAGKGVSVCHV